MEQPTILVIDDQIGRAGLHQTLFLKGLGLGTRTDSSWTKFEFCSGQRESDVGNINDLQVVAEFTRTYQEANLILLDVRFDETRAPTANGDLNAKLFGESILEWIHQYYPKLPVVLFTSKDQSDVNVPAAAFLSKEGLTEARLRACVAEHGRLSITQAKSILKMPDDVGVFSAAMLDVYRRAFVQAQSNGNVLILGESGTGKEHLAQYIHAVSPRASGPFEALNVSAIPDTLAEAELFGSKAGAYTGSRGDHAGVFQRANGGVLFLDEIGDMPKESQAKILRALQQREIRPLGAAKYQPVDVRLIAATHHDLAALVSAGRFREDLYYRVAGAQISIPPLRERPSEIVPLAQFLIERAQRREGVSGISIGGEAQAKLAEYEFLGNVRELENRIGFAVSSGGSRRQLQSSDFFPDAKANSLQTETVVLPDAVQPVAAHDPTRASALGLQALERTIRGAIVDPNSPDFVGCVTFLQAALDELLQHCAGAALLRYADPASGAPNRQRSAQLLVGTGISVRGARAERVFEKLMGKRLSEGSLEELMSAWSKRRSGNGRE